MTMTSIHPNWSPRSANDFKRKTFVRASETTQDPNLLKTTSVSSSEPEVVYQGAEARRVYEEIIQEDEEIIYCGKVAPKVPSKKTLRIRKQERHLTLALFKAIERNNVSGVDELLDQGGDVNTGDEFQWTPLMSAACTGSHQLTSLLLRRGAKRSCREKTGKTASDLARIKGHSQVADFIDAWDPLQQMAAPTKESEAATPSTSNASYFCDTCQQTFQETTRRKHCTSVVHQFNAKPEPPPTYYGIADSNRGFQMLLKSGWNREKGLGPEGSGLKFPTKTLLKRDRSGLGGKDNQLRVTHFAPYDTTAVAGRTRDKSKSVQPAANDKELRERERRKEIALRRELS